MSKGRFKFLIVLMSVAVFGLLLLQFGWVRNVHKLTEQKFHEDVQKALQQTSLDMESLEAVSLMGPDAFEQSLEGSLDDIVKNEFGGVIQSPGESISVVDTFIFIDGEKTKWLKVQGILIDTATGLKAEHRAIIKDQRGIVPIEVDDALLGLEHDTNSFLVQWNESFEAQVQKKANYLNWLMERMFNANPIGDIRLRINLDTLDKIIEHNLVEMGIDTTFRFNIVHLDTLGDRIVDFKEKSKHYELSMARSDMSTVLFPSDDLPSEYQLEISFPGQGLYVWKEMTGTLVASIVLVLVVMSAFYFAVSTIVKQKQLSEIKNDFISNMTHELRTPISTISLACEAVKDPDIGKDWDTLNSFISMIDQENKRLGKLVENVLQTALIDKGKLKLSTENCEVDKLVRQVVDSFQIRYKDKGGEIVIAKMDAFSWEVDKIHFVNVIYNLLDNSLKYCEQKPHVEVSLEKHSRGFSLEVTDNGIGIRKEDQKRIFEKLYRVPTGDVHNVKGFGLGLSYVASVVQLHNGQISIKSALGKGSTFKIIIHE